MDLDIQSWIDRIDETCKSKLQLISVEGIAQLSEANQMDHKSPAVYVVPVSESATRVSTQTTVHRQTITETVGVIIVVTNHRDRGASGHAELKKIRIPIRESLCTWRTPGCDGGAEFVTGDIFDYNDNVIWWLDQYLNTYTYQPEG